MDMTDDALQKAEQMLSEWAVLVTRPQENCLNIYLERQNFIAAVSALYRSSWGYLTAITGLDQPPGAESSAEQAGAIEVLYHFCRKASVLTLRVSLPYSDPVIDTICKLVPSATLYERELVELFGVIITGTPDSRRLLLPDDWPEGVYPMRKSFTGVPNELER
ncbi:MAG TPA: NADH-quinone oxidoreductase subunit C [Levilinea sp.]|nr:NADH-quinone oxidoreductase subunit C [Levilinea sp.]